METIRPKAVPKTLTLPARKDGKLLPSNSPPTVVAGPPTVIKPLNSKQLNLAIHNTSNRTSSSFIMDQGVKKPVSATPLAVGNISTQLPAPFKMSTAPTITTPTDLKQNSSSAPAPAVSVLDRRPVMPTQTRSLSFTPMNKPPAPINKMPTLSAQPSSSSVKSNKPNMSSLQPPSRKDWSKPEMKTVESPEIFAPNYSILTVGSL